MPGARPRIRSLERRRQIRCGNLSAAPLPARSPDSVVPAGPSPARRAFRSSAAARSPRWWSTARTGGGSTARSSPWEFAGSASNYGVMTNAFALRRNVNFPPLTKLGRLLVHLRRVVPHVLGDLHRAELGPAHRAEVGDLGSLRRQRLVVIGQRRHWIQRQVELILPAELEPSLAQRVIPLPGARM